MINVLIAEDHVLVRQGIRALLDKMSEVEVIGEASNGHEAIDMIRALKPDVTIMDIGMPMMSGIQALEKIQMENLNTKVVILSMHSDEVLVRQVLRSGAKGYLLKNSLKEELLLAIRAANQGNVYLSPAISGILVDGFLQMNSEQNSPLDTLTTREKEVLKLIAEGHTNSGIAQALQISPKTVEKHRAVLLLKLNVHDTAALIRYAIQYRLVFVDKLEN
ncbi:MAG: response regulator transcription factor [Chloroflexota bacterium]